VFAALSAAFAASCTAASSQNVATKSVTITVTQTDGPRGAPTASLPCTYHGGSGADFRVDIKSSAASCQYALGLLAAYEALPADGDHGNTNLREIDGWGCSSPTAGMAAQLNEVTGCTRGNEHIAVRPARSP
jgi:hypothetical protein